MLADMGEIWWIGIIPQELVLIHLLVSEKTGFTDLRTTDERRTVD